MDYREYARAFEAHRSLGQLSVFAEVEHDGRLYPLLRFRGAPAARTLLVTAGFHGEEPAGPLTLLEHLPELVRHASERGVQLVVYPCVNPSGFERGTRYNAGGEKPNNDFMRYTRADGSIVGELRPGEPDAPYTLFREGPRETRALRAELETLATPDGALDLHQDDHFPAAATYAYVFGDRARFRPLQRACAAVSPIAERARVETAIDTDDDGLAEYRDGSITDWMDRRGAKVTAALETTTRLPLERCHAVNRIWLKGFVELVAG